LPDLRTAVYRVPRKKILLSAMLPERATFPTRRGDGQGRARLLGHDDQGRGGSAGRQLPATQLCRKLKKMPELRDLFPNQGQGRWLAERGYA